jgi:tRNA/rRNA methyltransferase
MLTAPCPAPLARGDPTRFVLVEPSHAGNVGATARAMKVMGFGDLVLVRPRQHDLPQHAQARALASGAVDVLDRARVVGTLEDALDGITCACATAMTPRDFGPPTVAPRAGLAGLAGQGRTVAFVFGPERVGLANEDVYRCHVCLSIPTAPDYGSLNLGQAVQILAYEWRQALGGFDVRSRVEREPRADSRSLLGLLEHWRQTLERIGFLDPTAPRKLMPRLTRLILRARPTAAEVHILRGIARAVVAPDHAQQLPAAAPCQAASSKALPPGRQQGRQSEPERDGEGAATLTAPLDKGRHVPPDP